MTRTRSLIAFLGAALTLSAGCSATLDYAWCADHVEEVNAAFLARVYGEGAIFRTGDTVLKQRLRTYFADPSELPPGMDDNERRIADDSCRSARSES